MCCGTHVANLGMLQCVKLLGTETVKGNTRVSFVVGQAVVNLLGDVYDRVRVRQGCSPSFLLLLVVRLLSGLITYKCSRKRLWRWFSSNRCSRGLAAHVC
jgi:hypothetical protein